jgi:phosphoribosylglycinamide formyltransferase-1
MAENITEVIFETYQERPRVAILMSGSGSNARAILDDEEIRDLYRIEAIVSDNEASNATTLSSEYGVSLVQNHIGKFNSADSRTRYFDDLRTELRERDVTVALYAGFMKITTPSFCEAFPGVNVHPADLSIKGIDGLAKYRGMRAMPDMRRDLGFVRSTVHAVDYPFDTGSAISLSDVVTPNEEETDLEVHNRLKVFEHKVYVSTLKLLGRGTISIADIPLHNLPTIGGTNE